MIFSKVQMAICIAVLAVLLGISTIWNARTLYSVGQAVERIETMHEERIQRLEEMAH